MKSANEIIAEDRRMMEQLKKNNDPAEMLRVIDRLTGNTTLSELAGVQDSIKLKELIAGFGFE